jgi:hypothetical protein
MKFGPVHRMAMSYGKNIEHQLRGWGLRQDDLTSEGNQDLQRALRLLPPEVWDARRRLQRCTDMSSKHVHLKGEAYHAQQPFMPYVSPLVYDLEKRRHEMETYK